MLIERLELDGADVADRRVTSLPVVEEFDVVRDHGACGLLALGDGLVEEQLCIQGAVETLDDGVVDAVPGSTHRRRDVTLL